MKNIKIKILDPTGVTVKEMEMDWDANQLDRFTPSHRIIVEGEEHIVLYQPGATVQKNKDEN